jgi:hypothetical protein
MIWRHGLYFIKRSRIDINSFWVSSPSKTNLSSTVTAKLSLPFGRGFENSGFTFSIGKTTNRKRGKCQQWRACCFSANRAMTVSFFYSRQVRFEPDSLTKTTSSKRHSISPSKYNVLVKRHSAAVSGEASLLAERN